MPKQLNNEINILHLSDLHFGADTGADKTIVLNKLLESITGVDAAWRPELVVVSGDIGWHSRESDYKVAGEWLKRLLAKLELTAKELIVCPGNHDVNLPMAAGLGVPANAEQADEWLAVDMIGINLSNPFTNYMAFCKRMKIPAYKLGKKMSSYLAGCRELKGVNFIALNSAWFYRKGSPKDLWLGRPHVREMEAAGQLSRDRINIALFHHPQSYLNDADQNRYGTRAGTYRYIAEKSNIILTGHVHALPHDPPRIEGALLIEGGAAYSDDINRYHCSILKVDKEKQTLERNVLEYDAGYDRWDSKVNGKVYNLLEDNTKSGDSGSTDKSGNTTIINTNSPQQTGNNNTQNITYNN